MRDALGNVLPPAIPGGVVPAPGAAMRAPAGPQLQAAGLPTNASPAAQAALAAQRAIARPPVVPGAGATPAAAARPPLRTQNNLGVRGLGTVMR